MMIKRIATAVVAVGISLIAFASCSNDPTLTNNGSTTGSTLLFIQIARTGEPGLLEVFSQYSRHDASNRADVMADSTAMATDINTFTTGLGARSAATSAFIQNLLTPDVLIFDLSQSGDASYLGVETNGQILDSCNGPRNGSGLFGGRGLTEDVVDSTLGLVFGNTVSTIAAGSHVPNSSGAIADDGNEKDGRAGRPNLTTDNVGCGGKHFTLAQFPYLGAPR